jgi:hypothetical protein
MKIRYFIVFIFLFSTIKTIAQSKSNIHIGVHYFNLEDDKFSLDFIELGYTKKLSNRFNWDTNIGLIS